MKLRLPITEEVLRIRLATQTVKEIAEATGYERTRIYRKIKEFGIVLAPRKYHPKHDPSVYANDWLTDPVKRRAWSYLLGVYLGDGCVMIHIDRAKYRRPVFRLNTIDEDFREATAVAIEALSPYSVTKSPAHHVELSDKLNYPLLCGDPELCRRLVEMTADKTRFPDIPPDTERDLVAGLMDSEGFVGEHRKRRTNKRYYMGFKSCDVWVPDFIILLRSMGIKIGKTETERPRQPHYKPPTRFTINMQSWIDSGCYFNIRRKQERVEEWAAPRNYRV